MRSRCPGIPCNNKIVRDGPCSKRARTIIVAHVFRPERAVMVIRRTKKKKNTLVRLNIYDGVQNVPIALG